MYAVLHTLSLLETCTLVQCCVVRLLIVTSGAQQTYRHVHQCVGKQIRSIVYYPETRNFSIDLHLVLLPFKSMLSNRGWKEK